MILANTPKGPEEGPTEKAGRLGENLHHRTVQQFTVRKWWHTPLFSLYYMAIGLLFSGASMIAFSQFPWDDSTFWQMLMILLIASPHGLFSIGILVASIVIWANPYKLIFDGKGGLILRSVVRAQRIAIEDIKAVVLARQQNGEESADAPDICTKLSRGKLKLSRFAEREEFLKVLKAVHPAIVVETV
jgi:hypothetical protein